MQIKALNSTAEREEVGFIHSNGALVLFPNGNHGSVVINGWQGNYEASEGNYFMWRGDAIRILYEGDKVEITL